MRFAVEGNQDRERLDHFLTRVLGDQSRSRVRRWIDDARVLVNGEPSKAGSRLREGDVIEVTPPPPEPSSLAPERIPLQIVFEDDWLVVIDKPAGLVVHPGAGNRQGTLANALLFHFQRISRDSTPRPGIVHRLDKDTSGLLVVAKDDRTHQGLADQFKAGGVEKRYRALVFGRLEDDQGRIDAPVGRHPRSRTRMSTRARRPRRAVTEYRVIRRYEGLTYLEVTLLTGRTHQIRVHFEHLGHPVVGDATYNAGRTVPPPATRSVLAGLKRQYLHAAHLAFDHPRTESRVAFDSPLPPELAEILTRLE